MNTTDQTAESCGQLDTTDFYLPLDHDPTPQFSIIINFTLTTLCNNKKYLHSVSNASSASKLGQAHSIY